MKLYPEIKELSKEEVTHYPLQSFEGEITIVDTPEKADEAAEYLSNQKVIGFDTETKPSFKRGSKHKVALLQLSDSNRSFIFQLFKTGLTLKLVELFENPLIIKSGAAIHDDIKALQKHKPFKQQGFIDLQKFVARYQIISFSVLKLSALVLGFRISKSQRLSNWESPVLTIAQQKYAATDAWVCALIYEKLCEMKHLQIKVSPKLPKEETEIKGEQ